MQVLTDDLTPAQKEALAIMVEEQGEWLQAYGKMLRFGPYPYDGITGETYDNVADMRQETVDVMAAVALLVFTGALSDDRAWWKERLEAKADKLALRFGSVDGPAFVTYVEGLFRDDDH